MSVLSDSSGFSSVYTRYSRFVSGPPERSHASPVSASIVRSSCGRIASNWATLVSPITILLPNGAGPRPSGSRLPLTSAVVGGSLPAGMSCVQT